ncbi:MAG: hypothetical protein KF847_06520 [Pirellulales bacterium]|nr:hypothetical protein [Pirellulales bacterium]
MSKSVLQAIRDGEWEFEPSPVEPRRYSPTRAMPGTDEKLAVMAERIAAGLPLWHREDCTDYDDGNRQ